MDIARLQRGFDEALEQSVTARADWARSRFHEEPGLLDELLALLQAHDAGLDQATLRVAPSGCLEAILESAERLTVRPQRSRGDVVLSRYTVCGPIGEGGFSRVYLATDAIGGQSVALKLFRPPDPPTAQLIEREIGLLRYLDLPSVVRVIDDGWDHGNPCLITEFVDGIPFPGTDVDDEEELLTRTVRLLEALRRLHDAGVLHNDLKPANVLVDQQGLPTLIDLGIAHDVGVIAAGAAGAAWGTTAYLAPERALGKEATIATDLFAVGRIIEEALASLSHAVPEGGSLADLARACTADDPAKRPASCGAALAMLGRASPSDHWPSAGTRSLEELLDGPERIHHVKRRALALLRRRAQRRGKPVEEELRQWVRDGSVSMQGDRVFVAPRAMSRLETLPLPLSPGDQRAPSLVSGFRDYLARRAGGAPDLLPQIEAGTAESLPALALQLAGVLRPQSPALAFETLVAAVRFATGRVDADLERALLFELVATAITMSTLLALDRARYAISRSNSAATSHERLRAIVQAARLTMQGESPRALETLDGLTAGASSEELRLMHSVRVLGAQFLSPVVHREAVQAAAAWADSVDLPGLRAAVASWQGWLHYREGRFLEAAGHHEEAACRARVPQAQWSARMNAAAALLDGGAHAEAGAHASACLAAGLLTDLGVMLEARAESVLRASLYRDGEAVEVDHALLAAVEEGVYPHFAATIQLTEAAIAWRAGDGVTAREVASRAGSAWRGIGRQLPALLAYSLAAVSGGHVGTLSEALSVESLRGAPPGIIVQILGLAAHAGIDLSSELEGLAREALENIPVGERARRREVTSVDETLGWVAQPHASG